MATINQTVGPAKTHPTRSAWNALVGGYDLVTNGDIEQAECYDFSDTVAFAMASTAGFTDATHYFRMYAAAGNEHDGTFGNGARMEVALDYGYALEPKIPYTRIEKQSIKNSGTVNSGGVDFGGFDYITFIDNIVKADGDVDGSTRLGVNFSYTANGICQDNLIISTGATALSANNTSGKITNNTVIQKIAANTAVNLDSASANAKNNLAQGSICYSATSYTGTATNNLSEDATAPGTAAVPNTNITFTNEAGDDYSHSDAAADDEGVGTTDTDIKATDAIGVARGVTNCTIGCFEYVAGGASTVEVAKGTLQSLTGKDVTTTIAVTQPVALGTLQPIAGQAYIAEAATVLIVGVGLLAPLAGKSFTTSIAVTVTVVLGSLAPLVGQVFAVVAGNEVKVAVGSLAALLGKAFTTTASTVVAVTTGTLQSLTGYAYTVSDGTVAAYHNIAKPITHSVKRALAYVLENRSKNG